MGVPKFFRYISERYPCLSQLVLECEIPEFDNLYLDMNGIIHNCSHPNDFDPHFRITEEKIFKDIFHYIEVLFRIIKPQKLFFMAIDGVAPRAKMNQQRGRRFRSAKDAEEQEKAVLRKGETLPDVQRFDSNCITPGTSFMARLQAQLKYFVTSKISSDKSWQKVKVILSGHECPGEGEHKIMDYIRYMKSQLDYDPNTRHCLYGLDADLIMLGLCTHEPHFALLREEVKFGRKQQSKKISSPEEIKFFLLHLSLLREYLEMEFSSLKNTLNFKFNLENIIDDWVLMGFLVGNDFIPHLPGLHISSGALPVLFKAYCEVLPTLDGYLNEGGFLNLPRFESYMKKLGSFDIKQFRDIYDDLKYMKLKAGKSAGTVSENNIGFTRKLEPFFESEDKEDDCDIGTENNDHFEQSVLDMMDLEGDDGSDYYDEDDKEQDRLAFFQEFCLHKQNYYQDKLEYKNITPDELHGQAEGYVKALQWNLHYYYNGIRSWSWFYPHHYAPYISDIQNFKDIKLEFDLGKPFLPFEQLLAVLPALSKDLLPRPFQELMTDESSPIFDYYPSSFETDLNGKKNDWEAVVLIPFIDEEKLLNAMESCYHRLTDEEKQRNKHGPMHVYSYTENNLGRYESPAYFSPVEKNHAIDTPLYREEIIVPPEKLRKGLLEGVIMDVYFPGFPTFKYLHYTSSLQHQGVKVFQSSSQGLNMIVKIIKESRKYVFEDLVNEYINQAVYVSWPYLTEAKVVGISYRKKKCFVEGGVCKTVDVGEDDVKSFMADVNAAKQEFLKSRGIDVDLTEFLLQVRTYEGKKFVFSSGNKIALEKKWSNRIHSYPLQTIVKEMTSKDSLVTDVTIDDIFPVGCSCFLLNKDFYGCLGLVNDRSENGHVKIKANKPPEPEQHQLRLERSSISYYSNNEAAHRSCIPNHLLARITGTILVLDTDNVLDFDKCQKVNIGLNLKFSRRNQLLPGYTRRTGQNQWLYSDRTISLIKEYADTFPEVIRYLAENSDKDNIFRNDLFPLPGQSHMLSVISNWLNSKSELKSERRSCDSELLEADVIANLESKIEHFMKKNKRGLYVNLKAKPFHLYMPSSQIEKTPPEYAEFRLLDRVVNVRDNFVVPLGYRGTIIGIEKQQNEKSLTYCDILFDQSFSSAVQYNTKKKRVYKLPDKCLLNITYAKRKQEREDTRKTPQKHAAAARNSIGMIPNKPVGVNNHKSYVPLMDARVCLPVSQPYATVASSNMPKYVAGSYAVNPNTGGHVYSSQGPAPPHPQSMPSTQSLPPPAPGTPPATYSEVHYSGPINVQVLSQCQPPAKYEIANSSSPHNIKSNQSRQPVKIVNAGSGSGQEEKETTLALKKLLRISDENNTASKNSKNAGKINQENNRSSDEKNERGYVVELQDLFQKVGKGIPKYEYLHTDGNFMATLYLPGTELNIVSEPAPTKKVAGEKAAFMVLNLLNLVQNYGDRVLPQPPSEHSGLDLNLKILRLQQKLQERHQQQVPSENRPLPQASFSMTQDQDCFQSFMRSQLQIQQQQQHKLQMLLNSQAPQPNVTLPQTSAISLPQQMARQPQQYAPQPMSPFQPPRQMTMATNYIYQQNVPSKYPLPPQQLYYQNVQNFFYNQGPIRPNYSAAGPMPQQQWYPPVMPQPNLMNMPPNMQPRSFYPEQMAQPLSQSMENSILQNMNYYASSSQNLFTPQGPVITELPKNNVEPIQPSQPDHSTQCSGRISKMPKKSRLAANFATKAAT